MNRIMRISALVIFLLTSGCSPVSAPAPGATAAIVPSGTPAPTGTLSPSPTPEPTATPEPSPTPVDRIRDEVETGVNLLDKKSNHQWVLDEMKRYGISDDYINGLESDQEKGRIGFTGPEASMLTTENLYADVIIGSRVVQTADGGKLRVLIISGNGRAFDATMPVALDIQDLKGNWALLLPGVDAKNPTEVSKWIEENRFKLIDSIIMLNTVTDPSYLDNPSWTQGMPGDSKMRNDFIANSYVGWDLYDLAINGNSQFRKQNATLEQMFKMRALGLASANLVERLNIVNRRTGSTEKCLIGTGITVGETDINK